MPDPNSTEQQLQVELDAASAGRLRVNEAASWIEFRLNGYRWSIQTSGSGLDVSLTLGGGHYGDDVDADFSPDELRQVADMGDRMDQWFCAWWRIEYGKDFR